MFCLTAEASASCLLLNIHKSSIYQVCSLLLIKAGTAHHYLLPVGYYQTLISQPELGPLLQHSSPDLGNIYKGLSNWPTSQQAVSYDMH